MSSAERRFCIAGIEVGLVSMQPDGLDGLASAYASCPSRGGALDLLLEIERIPGFWRGRPRSPAYPAFDATLREPDTLALSRYDAEGELSLPDADHAPLRGRFRVGESPSSLEAIVRIGMSIAAPRRGGLVLHASAVEVAGQALVFAGTSGAGKSTIAAMLDGLPGQAAPVVRLADELLVVMPGPDGTWDVHVPPFLGGVALPSGARRGLAGVHFLAQTPAHRRTRLPRTEALRGLLPHVLAYVAEPGTAARVLAAGAALVAAVPCYRLEFARNPGVVRVLGVT